MLLKLLFLFCIIAPYCVNAVRYTKKGPTLSDPRGLNSNDNDDFMMPGAVNYNYVHGAVWPKPQQETRSNAYFTLDPKNFDFRTIGKQSDVLIEALTRYKLITFPDADIHVDTKMKQMLTLTVNVLLPYQPMDLKTDESYTLVVGAPDTTLVANTVWGALRGLESFSQVVMQNVSGYYHAQQTKIVDFPRFHHRGFLIDTSRHFVNLKFILQFIDALSYSKFNVLHWHVTDDQSFPFVSRHFPDLANKGSRDPVKSVYTPADVQRVIDYGRFRGVRILPEFDTPGHVQSWYSIPNLLTPCYRGGKPDGTHGPINPTLESTYVFLKEFFQEVSEVFPDPYLHLGGDEVYFGCWASNPQILSWMADHGMGKNFSLLEQYYEQRLLDIVSGLGKKYVVWQEVVDNHVKVKPDTVVNVWKGGWKNEMAEMTKMGFKTILSSCWYLNYISYGDDWRQYYNCDPHDWSGTEDQYKNVIGGTACMWGEFVDGVNLVSRSWSRGMTVGGRLWSSKETKSIEEAAYRMWEHRCRYLRRGIHADPIFASQYCRHEWENEAK